MPWGAFLTQASHPTHFLKKSGPMASHPRHFLEKLAPLASHPRQITEKFNEFGSQAIEKQSIDTQIALQNSTQNLGGLRNQAILRELRAPGSQNTIFIDKINPPPPSTPPRVQGAKLRRTTRTLCRRLTGNIYSKANTRESEIYKHGNTLFNFGFLVEHPRK